MSITGPYTVSSGSSANGTIVDNGGILYVDSGGSTSGTVVNSGGYETVYTGGVASGTKVSSGGFQYVDGGTATSTVVSSGGDESVSAGGYALDTQVENGGSANVEHGGSTSGTVVSSGGYEIVSSNGSATGTKIRSGGFQDVYVDGTAISATVSSGGEQDVSNGIASSTVIASGGDEYVSNGGSTVGTIVSGGGYEYVYSGGSASGTTVDSGGYEYVYYGGSATRTTVDSGGYEEVDIGAFESGAQINSGGMFSLNGGQATGVVVSSGGALELTISSALGGWTPPAAGGTIDGVKVSAGAEIDLNVVFGGSISGFVVSSGAFADVSGGSATATIINSGGYEQVQSGGFEGGGVVKSGGVAEFEGGEVSGLVVSSGGAVDLSNLTYVAGSSGYLVGTPSGGQYPVTVTEGSATAIFYVASSGSPPALHLVADSGGGTDVEFLGSATVSTIVGPSISGAVAGQTTTSETPVDPFSTVTIGDANAGATDVLTITLSSTLSDPGMLQDGLGFSNLVTVTPGVEYTLSGTAATVTSELKALVFSPIDGVPNTSVTTTFTLSDMSSAYLTPAVDDTTTVIDSDPAGATIATNGVTSLVEIGDNYKLESVSGGTGPLLEYQGGAVTAGQFGAGVAPVGAEKTAAGYEVAFSLGSNQYAVWNTDANGDFTSAATGVLSGASYALQELELSFGENLNGDSMTGPTTTSIGTNGSLAQVANQYALESGGTIEAWLEYQGNPVTVGQFGSNVAPVGAIQTANGYEVAWSLGSNQYAVWNTDAKGDFTSAATGVLTGSSAELEAVEGDFGEQFAGGGTPATPQTPTNGITPIGDLFELTAGGGTGPLLEYQGGVVTTGEFGTGVAPIAAVKTGNGYEVAFSLGSNQYAVWNTDANGDFTSAATGVLTGSSAELEAVEGDFGEDFAGSPEPTPIQIATNGTTTLAQAGNLYELNPSSGTGPLLEYQGGAVTAGQFGAGVAPVGAEKTAAGYEVAFSLGSNQYAVWNTDANGDFTSAATGVLSGASYALQELELSFGENLNGDSMTGPTTTSIGTNGSLAQVANQYALESGGTIEAWLEYQGNPVTVGQFGSNVAPVGAIQTANGYEVAWSLGSNQYAVWNTDAKGDFTSAATGVLTGSSAELEAVEGDFGEQFAGGGTPATPQTPTNGITPIGDLFELTAGGGTGPLLEYQGGVVTTGEFGTGVAPIAAVKTGNGYEVAFSLGSNQYAVWNTDANGDFTSAATGVLTGSSAELEAVEGDFGEDFAGSPEPTPIQIATNGTTTLAQAGNLYELNPSSGTGPLLEYQGGAVTAGQFGAGVAPVGAEKTAAGYEVAFSLGSNQYVVWNTDANGDFTSAATGVVSGTSPTLEAVEANFGETFAGAGSPASTTTIATNGTTALEQVGNLYELNPAGGGTGPLLEYQGAVVTAGEFGGYTPIGAEKTANGYEIAWGLLGSDQYTVWNTDRNGNYTSSATGVVSGQSFALEDLEPAFGEELNGDGKTPSAALITSTGAGGVLDLSAQTQTDTINLGANAASASAGLNAPSLGFTGTPDAITLGADADIVEYGLSPSSGIETISNFALGADELNIDLMGAANSTFEIYNTMVGGQNAISIFSSADPNHGVVLLNMPTADNAANLLASHLTFAGGHALIS